MTVNTGAKRATLTPAAVVDAALDVARKDGLAAVTVQRLCDVLSVTPPTIYHHVQNKQHLAELVADAVIGGIELPPRGEWVETVVELVCRTRAAFADYPGVAAFVNGHRPLPAATRLANFTMSVLVEELDPQTALEAYHVITVYNLGQMLMDTADSGRPRRGQRSATFLPRAANKAEYPALAAVKSDTGSLDPGDTHLAGLRWILAGIVHSKNRSHP